MTTYITADWHIGDERVELLNRPFKNANEMKDTILHNMCSVLKEEDTLIINGDVCYKDAPDTSFLQDIPGKKILIRGNHDINLTEKDLSFFDNVIKEGDGIYYHNQITKDFYWITHYPTQSKKEYFNLVGHIHSSWKVQLNMLNVGVDVNHFRPYNIDVIVPKVIGAITNFYDADVWCAYIEQNASFYDVRGKKTRYLKG